MEVYTTLCIYSLLLVLVNHARLMGSSAIGGPCPSGSIYQDSAGLTDFPPELRNINCSRLHFDYNYFTTLMNGRCATCDYLSFDYNKLEVLTVVMLAGFPNIRHLSVKHNLIMYIEGDILTPLKRLDIEHNPVENIPWGHAVEGQKFSLEGTTILCDCAVTAGVVILTAPRCKGDPEKEILERLQCPATPTSQRKTTDLVTEVASETTDSLIDTYVVAPWVIPVMVSLLVSLISIMMACCYRYREEIDAKDGRRMRRIIGRMPWCTAAGNQGEQEVEGSKMLPPPANTPSNYENGTALTNGRA